MMDTPVCLSQDFVNKQNVRSFANILKHRTLKSDKNLTTSLYGLEEELINDITPDLLSLLTEMKVNLSIKSKNDFKQYFEVVTTDSLQQVNKLMVFRNTWCALRDIVPRKLLGDRNAKIFKRMAESAIFSMRRQHFMIGRFIHNWEFTTPLWKAPDSAAKRIMLCILVWILKNIVSPIISLNFYVTTCKIDADENKLHFYWKHQWQSFYDKKISEMIFTKVLTKCEAYCTGKKIGRTHSLSERLKLKSLKKDVPKLHLILKANNGYRPIVQYKKKPQNKTEKYIIKERLNFLRMLIEKPHLKIEILFAELYKKWVKLDKPKLYFVKTDLSNAFGAVDKGKLLKIICKKHLAVQKAEKQLYLKKKLAQQYRDIITELRKPLLVRAGSTIFEWKEGLVQGYKYSPALSELYYEDMDEIYLAEHFETSEANIKLFTRVVDDYLYITNSLDDAHSFLNAITNYRNVNYSKTEVNFQHSSIKFSEDISFLGYTYNTKIMKVSRTTSAFSGQMCYKIPFTGAISNVNKFLENRISQSGIPINSLLFNLSHNPEAAIWSHVFTTFCISANKFCTTLAILCEEKEMLPYLVLYKKKVVVKLSNCIIETLFRNKPADMLFVFCVNHFRLLSWKALYLCAKGTPKCSVLIPPINKELAKTNCVFGKWREHASNINSNGDTIQEASKQICKRPDLKMILKQFDNLPTGFECYNHKKLNK